MEDGADLGPEPLWWCLGPGPEEDEEDEVPCLSLLSFPEGGFDPPLLGFFVQAVVEIPLRLLS